MSGSGADRRWVVLLGALTSVVFVWLTFRRVDVAAFFAHVEALPWAAVPVAIAIKAVGFWCAARRSRILFAPLAELGTVRLYRSILLGFVGNTLLPLRAGEVMRAGYLAHHGRIAASSCLSAIALERILDLLCLLAIAAAVVPELVLSLPADSSLYLLGAAAAAVLVAAWWASRYPAVLLALASHALRPFPRAVSQRVTSELEHLVGGLRGLASPRAALAGAAWTAGFWLSMLVNVALWLWAFGIDTGPSTPVFVLVFLSFGAMLPSTPGQIGTYHYFATTALVLQGIPDTQAAAFAVVLHFMSFVPFTLIGIAVLLGEYLRGQAAFGELEGARSK